MEYAELGTTGVEISRIVLGCGNFGGIGSAPELFGRGESDDEAAALMDAAWEAGITTFDTADAYGGGRSETYIGDWLRTQPTEVRHSVQLATKVFNPMGPGDPGGLAPGRIRRQLESSLERLGVERVELYLTHAPDPEVPLAETLAALGKLQRSGHVGHVGASNVDGAVLSEALELAGSDGLARYEWVQNEYSLLAREAERDVLPLAVRHGLGFTPFSPLSGGWLTGKYRRDEEPPAGSRMTLRPEPYEHLRSEETFAALERFEAAAAARGVEPAALAIAWLLAQPGVTAVVIGPRRPEQIAPALRALELDLSPADADEVAALFPT